MRARSRLISLLPVLVLSSAAIAGFLGLPGCNEYGVPAGTSPHYEFNFLDMVDQPKMKAQRGDLVGGSGFMPSPGSIPRGFTPYPYQGKVELADASLKNPLPAGNDKILERGKVIFERLCVPCHDANGGGKGTVVEKGFPPPPSLMTQKLRDWPDAHIYHIISEGQNIMPAYASQAQPNDRWSAIHYLRRIQAGQPVAPPPVNAPPAPAASASASAAGSSSAAPALSGSAVPAISASAAPSAAVPASAKPIQSAMPSPKDSR